ncbi:hypothetical protein PLUTO_00780 [Luteibacter phage vB_LflM-Pluto]|uniref:Uncharacterized protein n=1 Tax=Luteibacter phage vB_LflM-Pluto TaxID=2948611 RepID=A0A9E7MTT2_9CAUD|nr:hypothetical protein PLUTO_00780 [Luteibacter phage vB_LflM-Pluto]
MKSVTIVGAGLAGLISACVFKDAQIFEASGPVENHKALLRFRDESVSTITGIPFKAVQVHKNIAVDFDLHDRCTNAWANAYSMKVTGRLGDRSIRNLSTVTRYVAPDDFYQQLVDMHSSRIQWNRPIERDDFEDLDTDFISTMPLPVTCGILDVNHSDAAGFNFDKKAIKVFRFLLPSGSDVYQTNYYPSESLRTYRASITGRLMIVEQVMEIEGERYSFRSNDSNLYDDGELAYVASSFGIPHSTLEPLDSVDQQYGKIVELDRSVREAILHELTARYNIFSIGRFATWRNILLDDVVKDIEVVRRLMSASSYGRKLLAQA